MKKLLIYLKEEKQAKRKGGLYHKTQVNLANEVGGTETTLPQKYEALL